MILVVTLVKIIYNIITINDGCEKVNLNMFISDTKLEVFSKIKTTIFNKKFNFEKKKENIPTGKTI